MEIKRLRVLALEIFRTLNDFNPDYMKNRFQKSPFATHKPENLYCNPHNTATYCMVTEV